MNCAESQQRLQDRLDGLPVTDRSALDRHLAECPACRGLHAVAGRLEQGLRLLERPAPPPGFAARVASRALADQADRLHFRRRWGRVAALAAGFLVAVGAWSWLRQGPGPAPPTYVAVTAPEPMPEPRVASLRDSVAEAGHAFVSLTRRTADETVGHTRLFIPEALVATPLTVPDTMPPSLDPPVQTIWHEAGQGMSASLAPMRQSARRAFSLLLRDPSLKQ